MLMNIKPKKAPLLCFILLFSINGYCHPGGLDKSGGHTHKSTGEYHCHRDPCSSQWKQSEKALQEAVTQKREFSLVYRREDWKHWSDFDSDCMNTRHEILLEQAVGPVKLSPDGCYVSKGVWNDPYSGKTFYRASDLDIDHVVAISWAHRRGGDKWSPRQKELFANDPVNLLAVDDGLNKQKSDKGPSEWMPPNISYHCKYLNHWEKVLKKYPDIKMTEIEMIDFENKMAFCG